MCWDDILFTVLKVVLLPKSVPVIVQFGHKVAVSHIVQMTVHWPEGKPLFVTSLSSNHKLGCNDHSMQYCRLHTMASFLWVACKHKYHSVQSIMVFALHSKDFLASHIYKIYLPFTMAHIYWYKIEYRVRFSRIYWELRFFFYTWYRYLDVWCTKPIKYILWFQRNDIKNKSHWACTSRS